MLRLDDCIFHADGIRVFFPFVRRSKVNPARDAVGDFIEVLGKAIFASCVRKVGGVYELLEAF